MCVGGFDLDFDYVKPYLPAAHVRGFTGIKYHRITGEIERAKSIIVRAQNLDGDPIELETSGFLARAIQHEVDHLNGILFIDRMSSATKTSLSSKLKRLQKETQRGAKHRQKAVAETTL